MIRAYVLHSPLSLSEPKELRATCKGREKPRSSEVSGTAHACSENSLMNASTSHPRRGTRRAGASNWDALITLIDRTSPHSILLPCDQSPVVARDGERKCTSHSIDHGGLRSSSRVGMQKPGFGPAHVKEQHSLSDQ